MTAEERLVLSNLVEAVETLVWLDYGETTVDVKQTLEAAKKLLCITA